MVFISRPYLGGGVYGFNPPRNFGEKFFWAGKRMVSNEQRPHSAIDSFVACNGDFFPNVKALLCILTTLPVSTATAERSFSTLKRIKTYLRNSMGDSRLSGLALLSIHREIEVNPAEVLDRFAKAPRRDKLLL